MKDQTNTTANIIDVDEVIKKDKSRCFFHTINFNITMWLHQMTFKFAIIKSKFKRKA